jgi:hypothetical protein
MKTSTKKIFAGIGLVVGTLLIALGIKNIKKPCTEGRMKCDAGNLYACVNGKWKLQELNSPVCVLPESCSVDADCPPGYVCENGVCVPQSVKQWEFYGVVTDIETHAPIPSVTVSMNGISSIGDSEGKYTISGVVDTEHIVVTFSAEGYAPREYGVGWSGKPYELNAALVQKEIAQATLYGTVTDTKGNLVEGATLSLYWDGETHPEYSRTISSSYSVSAVSPGTWRVTVEKQGYETWDKMVTVIGGEPNELNIVLTQIWDWEGIWQPSDYLSKWEEMVAQQGSMEGVIADIAQIPGIQDNAATAGQNLYWGIKGTSIADFSAVDGHGRLIHYLGWEQKLRSLSESTVAYIAHILETNVRGIELDAMAEKYGYSDIPWLWFIFNDPSFKDRYHISDADFATIAQDVEYVMQWSCHVVGINPYTRAGPCAESDAWDSVIFNYLNYIAVYAECKRHGSMAPSYREFWDNLGTREYGPGCPGTHCQVAGYIFYDGYGSGIGWDVGYRSDRWVNLYLAGELLHYV